MTEPYASPDPVEEPIHTEEEAREESLRHLEETNRLLREQNELLRKQIAVHSDWRYIMGRGALTGLMTVIGATVLVSLVLWALRPFTGIERLGPMIERLTETLEERPARP